MPDIDVGETSAKGRAIKPTTRLVGINESDSGNVGVNDSAREALTGAGALAPLIQAMAREALASSDVLVDVEALHVMTRVGSGAEPTRDLFPASNRPVGAWAYGVKALVRASVRVILTSQSGTGSIRARVTLLVNSAVTTHVALSGVLAGGMATDLEAEFLISSLGLAPADILGLRVSLHSSVGSVSYSVDASDFLLLIDSGESNVRGDGSSGDSGPVDWADVENKPDLTKIEYTVVSDGDLNVLTDPGWYVFTHTPGDSPFGQNGIVRVIPVQIISGVIQLVMQQVWRNEHANTDPYSFIRRIHVNNIANPDVWVEVFPGEGGDGTPTTTGLTEDEVQTLIDAVVPPNGTPEHILRATDSGNDWVANVHDGRTLYGAGVPGAVQGINGDSFVDTLTGKVYHKSGGSWFVGVEFLLRDKRFRFHYGNGAVPVSTMEIGDVFLKISTGVFSQKTGSSSSATITNLVTSSEQAIALSSKANSSDLTTLENAVTALTTGAPALLNTLDEIAAALGDDPNLRTTLVNLINAKLDASAARVVSINSGLYTDSNNRLRLWYVTQTGALQNVDIDLTDLVDQVSGSGGGGGDSLVAFFTAVEDEAANASYNPIETVAEILQDDVRYIIGPLNALGALAGKENQFVRRDSEGDLTFDEPFLHQVVSIISVAEGHYGYIKEIIWTGSAWLGFTEGRGTRSTNFAHAEGVLTDASGAGAHAEGTGTVAEGTSSHAEGFHTRTPGANAHSGGEKTTANKENSFIHGSAGVVGHPDTLVGFANGNITPSATQRAADENMGLVARVERDGTVISKRGFMVEADDGTLTSGAVSGRTALYGPALVNWAGEGFGLNTDHDFDLSVPLGAVDGAILIMGNLKRPSAWTARFDARAFFDLAVGSALSMKVNRSSADDGWAHTTLHMFRLASNSTIRIRSHHASLLQDGNTAMLSIQFIPDAVSMPPGVTSTEIFNAAFGGAPGYPHNAAGANNNNRSHGIIDISQPLPTTGFAQLTGRLDTDFIGDPPNIVGRNILNIPPVNLKAITTLQTITEAQAIETNWNEFPKLFIELGGIHASTVTGDSPAQSSSKKYGIFIARLEDENKLAIKLGIENTSSTVEDASPLILEIINYG